MAPRLAGPILIASLLVGLLVTATSATTTKERRIKGKALLEEKCGRCHAVGATGESPLHEAPPMRTIYARFSPRELQAELRQGMVSRHRAMPQIEFSDEETDAILAYLYALAIRNRH